MATTINQNDLDQNNQNQTNNNQPGNNTNQPGIGPQQTGQPGNNQQSTVQSYNPNKQQGSGYTNIQRIVQANQGNKLGQTVGQGIQQAGQQVSGQLNQAQNQFQQQTGQNQVNTAQNQQLAQNVLANPDQFIDPNSAQGQQGNQFSQLLSGVYQGPKTLQNAQQLQGQASDVAQMNQALGSAGGRMGLLSRFVGNPQYNSGQQTLDSLLLGKSQGQDLSQARLATAGLGKKVAGAEQGAEAQAGIQSGAAQAFGNQLRDQFGNKISGMDTNLQQQAKDAQTARDTQYQQTIKDLQSGQLNQQEASLLGINPNQEITENMLNNIGNYVTENPLKASAQNIASQQDYARLNALRQLGGQNVNSDTQNILGQYADQDKNAGAFQASQAATPDQSGFNTALQSQLQQYHQMYDPAKQKTDLANQIYTLTKQRDAINPGGVALGQWTPQGQALQNQITQLAPGAGTNTKQSWAQSNAETASKQYQDTMNNLNSQYGAIRNLQINPNQKPIDIKNIQTASGPQDLGLENMPRVT